MRGTAVQVCDQTRVGDGRCDYTNDMVFSGCGFDGGDCCLATCYANCVARQLSSASITGDVPYSAPQGIAKQCTYMCGEQSASSSCPFLCLADDYMGAGANFTSWCTTASRGQQTAMGSCYSTNDDVVSMLLECIKDDASHGNLITGNSRCGNQTGDCTLADVAKQVDGCHLHPQLCTAESCCSTAINRAWIDPTVKVLPSRCEAYTACAADPDCFSTMAQCGRTNKACRGGCCMCSNNEWYGHNCDQPLCWPKCKNGRCVSPNSCYCDEGYSGASCEVPVCDPECVGGQGVCISPNVCECFYGWTGTRCEQPKSTPPCVNGLAVAPDVCMCDSGWGGRICDYPLCQSLPEPSADCGHGICEASWKCKCEPGWTVNIPAGLSDGIDVPPLYWKGRDLIGDPNYIPGDTRFNGSIFDEYNAFKCDTPSSCSLIFDNRCKTCTGEQCVECIPGFFLETTNNRCERCSLRFPRCKHCSADQCLACDPVFSLVDQRCVSDGIFEFSSPLYNVRDVDDYAEVTVLRSIDSLDFEWAMTRPTLSLIVQTETVEGSAIFKSIHAFADFENVRQIISFPPPSISSVPNLKADQRRSIVLKQLVRIPIFDNLVFDEGISEFHVKLILDPRVVAGTSGTSPILSSVVRIWDTRIFDYSTCFISPVFLGTALSLPNGTQSFSVPITCQSCNVTDSGDCGNGWTNMSSLMTPPAMFATVSRSSNGANIQSRITSSATGAYTNEGFLNVSANVPFGLVTISVLVQTVFPGMIGKQFLLTANPATGQAPDVLRLEKNVNQTWVTAQEAPPLIVYSGYMHFGCVPSAFSNLAVTVSEGATISLQLDDVEVISAQRSVVLEDSDSVWQAPMESFFCGDGTVFCYNSSSPWSNDQILRLNITFKPSQLFYTRPAGVRFFQADTQGNWAIVPSGCLYGGVDMQNSPIRGIEIV
jgi:hypothetical protein